MNSMNATKQSKSEGHTYSVAEPTNKNQTKKQNVNYWDGIDGITEDYIRTIAQFGGITIEDVGEYSLVKELVELTVAKIKEEFPEAHFPFVDENH